MVTPPLKRITRATRHTRGPRGEIRSRLKVFKTLETLSVFFFDSRGTSSSGLLFFLINGLDITLPVEIMGSLSF